MFIYPRRGITGAVSKHFIRLWAIPLAFVLVASATSPPAQAQDISEVTRKIHRTYAAQDGLPQASVYTIGIDMRGWVWVGTQNGVAYFDGHAWRTLDAFNRAISAGFWRGQRISEDADGTLWFATQGGILSLDPRPPAPANRWTFEHYTRSDGLPSDSVMSILHRDDGSLLAGTRRGAAVFHENEWQRLPLPENIRDAPIYAMHYLAGGELLVSTAGGLYRRDNEQWERAALPASLAGAIVHSIFEDSSETLWLGLEGGLARRQNGSWEAVLVEEGRTFVAIDEAPNGQLWVGSESNGVYVYDTDATWSVIQPEQGLGSPMTHAVASHPDGTMWVGTMNGLSVYDPSDWDVIDAYNGLPSDVVWAIMQSGDGDFWFGTGQGVAIYEGGGWNYLNEGPAGAPMGTVLAFHEAPDGTVWIGGAEGLFHYDNGEWLLHEPNLFTYAFLRRSDGALLVTTRSGVYTYVNGSIEPFRPGEAMLRGSSKSLTETRDGVLLIALEGLGVLRLEADTTRLLTEQDGLASSSVLDIYEDPDGLLWFITTEGVSLFDGRRWRTLSDTSTVALPDRFAYRIERDSAGRYYVSTNRGIARLTKHPAGSADLDRMTFTLEHFGMDEGLPAFESNQGASFRDAQGRIWFGLTGGAAVYNPSLEPSVTPAGPVTLTGISVAGTPDSIVLANFYEEGLISLWYDHTTIRFDYAMGAPGRSSDIRFKTRLVGLDGPASDWSPANHTYYTRLPAGDYTFEVVGKAAAGGPVQTASTDIHVDTPPWATGWAYAAYVLLILFAGASAAYAQSNRVRRRDDETTRQEQDRLSRAAAMSRAAYLQSENERLLERNRAHEFRRRVMEGSSDAIFSLDPEGRVTLYNAPFQQMLGAHTNQDFRSLFDEEEGRKVDRAMYRVVQNGHTIHDLALELTPGDASPRYLALALSPLRVEGSLEGVVGVARDVTEKRNLEQFRNDMIRMFVHDLRNPLSNMLMAGRALAEDDLEHGDYRRMAKMIETNCEQAILLVEGMLDVSRLEAGRMPIELEEIDLADVMREVVEPMTPMAEKKSLTLNIDETNGLSPVYADAGLLRRVLRNLIDNAIKFTPPSGAITIHAQRGGDKFLEVVVSDTGPGVPIELRSYLFQKFAAGAGPDSGSGLGLAFCRLAVESLGGRLWLDAESPHGATFRFTLQSKQQAVVE